MWEIKYHWLQLESGKTGTTTRMFLSKEECLQLVNEWNNDDRWKYWVNLTDLNYAIWR